MIRVALLSLAMQLPSLVLAQQSTGQADDSTWTEPVADADTMGVGDGLGDIERVTQPLAAVGRGALLRGLDRVSGELTDLTLSNGESRGLGPLEVKLVECRYPVDNPSGDAYAYLVIDHDSGGAPLFQGWMIASSPALNAMDHRRYDVWVLRCIMS